VGRILHRTGVRLTLAAIVAGLTLCVGLPGAVGAPASSANPVPMMTYITGLPSSPFVWVAFTDGSSPARLGQASSALISPSGAEVAAVSVARQTNAWTLWLYSTATNPRVAPVTLIPKRPQPMTLLAWSPDSRLILVTVGTTPAQLLLVDTTTQQSHAIATGVISGASFAPGGSDAIVYARSRAGNSAVNLYTTTDTGTDTRQLTHDGRSELPLWGPSGIVYSRETARAKNPYPELQLWLMNADGGGARQLTDVSVSKQQEGLVAQGVSNDGSRLLANLVSPTGANITVPYTVTLSGHKPTTHQLTASGFIGDAISGDGQTILVTKGTASDVRAFSIETFPWSGGTATPIVKQGGYASWNCSSSCGSNP
jgi:Tol biopolymer transport system component